MTVRDNQPSTIIAFALASDTYNNQLVEIQRGHSTVTDVSPHLGATTQQQQQQHIHSPPIRSNSSSSLTSEAMSTPVLPHRSPKRRVENPASVDLDETASPSIPPLPTAESLAGTAIYLYLFSKM